MATGGIKHGSYLRGSDDLYSLICLPCHRHETTKPACCYCINCREHLCLTCSNYHRKVKPCRHHELLDKDAMPLVQHLTDKPAYTRPTNIMESRCQHHPKERIKMYCNTHNLLLCSICVGLEHNKCRVDYIHDVSAKMVDSRDYQDTINRIDELCMKSSAVKLYMSKEVTKSKNSLKNALQEVKSFRHEINERMDKLQTEIENEIQVLDGQYDEKIKTLETICDDITVMTKSMSDCMKQLNTSNQADQLFMEVKHVQTQLHHYEQSISSLSTEDFYDNMFIPSQAINDVLHAEGKIGSLSSKNRKRPKSSLEFRVGHINVKTKADRRRNCCIVGLTMLPPKMLVLADAYNNSVKLVDVNTKSITSTLSFGTKIADKPSDITATTNTKVAVTFPDKGQIQFISVLGKLSKSHTIKTNGNCNGICCHQNKLVTVYANPGKLEVLDMNGKVITSVKTDSDGKDVFKTPKYVQANMSSIYVSDIGLNEVTKLNWKGEITGRISEFYVPRGLALLGDGRLVVCDPENNKVWQVSNTSTLGRLVLQDVNKPVSVCVDYRGHRLYIGRWTEDDKVSNNLLVHSLYLSKVEDLD